MNVPDALAAYRLSPTAVALYVVLLRHADQQGKCSLPDRDLLDEVNVSHPAAIATALVALLNAKLVESAIRGRGRAPSAYTVVMDPGPPTAAMIAGGIGREPRQRISKDVTNSSQFVGKPISARDAVLAVEAAEASIRNNLTNSAAPISKEVTNSPAPISNKVTNSASSIRNNLTNSAGPRRSPRARAVKPDSGTSFVEVPRNEETPSPPPTPSPPIVAAEPAPSPGKAAKKPGLNLAPLFDAFRDRALPDPVLTPAEAHAASELLRHYPATEIAACWQDHATGDYVYADDFAQRDLSFGYLMYRQRVSNWARWVEQGRPAAKSRASPKNGRISTQNYTSQDIEDQVAAFTARTPIELEDES